MGSFNELWGPKDPDDEDKQKTHPSNPYQQKWDPLNTHTYEAPPPDRAAFSHAVLSELKPRRQQETSTWLITLQSDVLATTKGDVEAKSDRDPLHKWVDQMFDCFQRFAVTFNKTAQGTDYIVTCTRPQYLQDQAKSLPGDPNYISESEIVLFRGRLVTRYWGLVIRGYKNKVKVFILPAVDLFGFRNENFTEKDLPPFMEIATSIVDGNMVWKSCDKEITFETLPALSRELFGDLIRVASGTMDKNELFCHHQTEPKLGENVAVGYNPDEPGQPSL